MFCLNYLQGRKQAVWYFNLLINCHLLWVIFFSNSVKLANFYNKWFLPVNRLFKPLRPINLHNLVSESICTINQSLPFESFSIHAKPPLKLAISIQVAILAFNMIKIKPCTIAMHLLPNKWQYCLKTFRKLFFFECTYMVNECTKFVRRTLINGNQSNTN